MNVSEKVSICDIRVKKKCEFQDDWGGEGVDLVQDCGSLA